MTTNKSVNRMFFIVVALYIAVSLLVGSRSHVELPVIAAMLISQIMIIGPVLIYCLMKKISIRQLIPFRKMKLSVWVLVVVCTYLMYPLLIVLNAISLIFVESGTAELLDMMSGTGFLLSTLLMAVIPAFVEEFVFRGVMFGTYKKSKMLAAIFLSAFLFGCMHMNFNQFLYAFMLGIYMAFLVEATGSILSSMLAHFTINFTSVVMSFGLQFLQKDMVTMPETTGNFLGTMDKMNLMILAVGIIFWLVIAVGTTAGAVGVYIAISKISGRWEYVKSMFKQGDRKRLITVPLVLAILLMIAIMIYTVIS